MRDAASANITTSHPVSYTHLDVYKRQDHHGSNDGFGKKNLIRPDAGGCAEVLYDVLTALGVKFTDVYKRQ